VRCDFASRSYGNYTDNRVSKPNERKWIVANQRGNPVPPQQQVGLLAGLVRDGQLVWRLMGDPRVATAAKVIVPILAVLYVLSPVDLIPDVIPVLGQMDDLAILALAVRLFIQLAPPQVVAEHRDDINGGGGRHSHSGDGETVDAEYRVIH
jgi:uncharacterized membrane protein YkvA (DUF1232 family)